MIRQGVGILEVSAFVFAMLAVWIIIFVVN